MADELRIVISAQDGASKVLQQISKAADSLADSLGEAGEKSGEGLAKVEKSAQSASKGMMQVSQAGDGTIRTLEGMSGELSTIGSGLQSAGTALDAWSASARNQQQTLIGLQAAFGDAASEMVDFGRQMADSGKTIFNDDDILRGERYFATLKNNYDLSTQQIKQLMETTADLASASGVSFEDASSRVTAAIRGEGEAAEYLSLTMNQQSIDRDNLTLSMTNQEAAQFRLNALNEQAAAYSGSAQKLAQSEVGAYAAITNKIEDMGQAVGATVGPWGSLATVMGRGLATVGEATRGVTDVKAGLTGLVGTLKNSTTAMAALSLATGPVGIAIAGIGLALAGAAYLWQSHNKDVKEAEKAYEDFQTAVKGVDDSINDTRLSGNIPLAEDMEHLAVEIRSGVDKGIETAQNAIDNNNLDWKNLIEGENGYSFEDLSAFLSDGVGKAALDFAKSSGTITQQVYDELTTGTSRNIVDATQQIQTILNDYWKSFTPDDADKLAIEQDINELFQLMANPHIDQDMLNEGVGRILTNLINTGDIDTAKADFDKLIADLKAGATEVQEAFEGIEWDFKMDDFRLKGGMGDIIADVTTLRDIMAEVPLLADRMLNNVGTDAHSGSYIMLAESMKLSADSMKMVESAQTRINAAMETGTLNNDRLNADIAELVNQYAAGAMTGDQFAASFVAIAANLASYRYTAQEAISITLLLDQALQSVAGTVAKGLPINQSWGDRLAQSLGLDFNTTEKVGTWWDNLKTTWAEGAQDPPPTTDSGWREYILSLTPGSEERAQAEADYKEWLGVQQEGQQAALDSRADFLAKSKEYDEKAKAQRDKDYDDRRTAAEESAEADREAYEERAQIAADWIATSLELAGAADPLSQINLAGVGDEYSNLAGEMADTGTTIDTVTRVIIGNTDAIKSQAEGLKSWADELINVRGEMGRIDDLVSSDPEVNPYGKPLITGTSGVFDDGSQYAAAQDAYDSIADSTAKIAINIDAIQAIQAPFIADFLDDQVTLLENLRGQDEVQQRITLGWMDQNTAAAANTIITQAAAAANGELGAKGVEATESMIEGAIALNPFLEDMLVQIGLISVTTDALGNKQVTINTDMAKGAASDIEQLNTSIRTLIDLLDNGRIDGSVDFTVNGAPEVEAAGESLKNVTLLDGTVVQVDTDVDTTGWDQSTVGDLINRGDDVKVKTVLEPPTGWTVDDWNNSDGPLPSIPIEIDPQLSLGDEGLMLPVMDPLVVPTTTAPIDTPPDYTGGSVEVPASVSFAGNSVDGDGTAGALAGAPQDITIGLLANDEASGPIGDVSDLATGLDGTTSTVNIAASDEASGPITDVGDLATGLDGQTSTVNIAADTSDAEAGISWAQGYDGTVLSTSYMDIVTRKSTITLGGGNLERHGGIPKFAMGGTLVPFWAAEAGGEVAHFAGGGTAYLPTEGMYAAPPGTYISPNNANKGAGGNTFEIHVHVEGGSGSDEEMAYRIGRVLIPIIADGIDQRQRGAGVV